MGLKIITFVCVIEINKQFKLDNIQQQQYMYKNIWLVPWNKCLFFMLDRVLQIADCFSLQIIPSSSQNSKKVKQ